MAEHWQYQLDEVNYFSSMKGVTSTEKLSWGESITIICPNLLYLETCEFSGQERSIHSAMWQALVERPLEIVV